MLSKKEKDWLIKNVKRGHDNKLLININVMKKYREFTDDYVSSYDKIKKEIKRICEK